MKKSNMIATLIIMIISAATFANASEITLDFDGKASKSGSLEGKTSSVAFEELIKTTQGKNLPEPAPIRVVGLQGHLEQNSDQPILNGIKYCGTNGIKGEITDNLNKLLVYGTGAEKMEFERSSKYIFPQRFAKFDNISIEELVARNTKRPETHCWEDNCRMKTVCNRKEECEDVTEIICTAIAVGGLVTGNIPTAVGGEICKPVMRRVCKMVDDCAEVQVCDNHCETINVNDGTDTTDGNGNVVAHQ